ncbi:substrate-binding domain-containing protein, partial [Klebsiella aerogenes]
ALEENGIAPLVDKKNVIEVPCTRTGGEEAFAQIKQNNSVLPTAFICFSDVIAFGVMDAARQSGLQIPRDISVTGFDDIDESAC